MLEHIRKNEEFLLDKRVENEKELIRLRRLAAARTTRARSAQFACGANYLAPGGSKRPAAQTTRTSTKGGLFVFVYRN